MRKILLSALGLLCSLLGFAQQMDLPVTFDAAGVDYGVIGFEGAEASSIEVDPTDAANTVVKVIKSATAQPWAGTTVTNAAGDGLASAIPFTASSAKMSLRVWSPDAGIPVRLKVEDHSDPTHSVETDAFTTVAGQWETLVFNFENEGGNTPALNLAYTYDKASVFFNYGTNGAATGEKTYYFDDLDLAILPPAIYNVTFQVDMQNVTGFTTPEVNGTFNGWCGNCNAMTDANSDGIWEVTLALTEGNYEYKYSYDAWMGEEALTPGSSCTITSFGNTNRTLTLNADVVIPAVCWNSCVGCNVVVLDQMDLPVTFEEATVEYGVIGFDGAEASTIEVDPTDATNTVVKVIKSATAQPWAGTTVTNANGDGLASAIPFTATEKQMSVRVWSPNAGIPVRLKVEDHSDPTHSVETEATTISAGAWETLIFNFANHAIGTAAYNAAYTYDKASVFFNFGTSGATAGEKTYYFDDLDFYTGSVQSDSFQVTFQVDMQNVTGFTTPEVNGTIYGWTCGGCAPMSDANSDGIWDITITVAPGTYEYKYAYDNWAGQETLAPGGSCVLTTGAFTNRIITVDSDITLPVVCWGSCSSCDNPSGPFNVTFQVDMHDVTAAFTTPEVNGTFNGWCGGCAPMTDANSDGIWEITIPLPADTIEFKFAYDSWTGQESLTSGSVCTITSDGFTNRQYIVTENVVLPAVCWASCEPCIVGINDVAESAQISLYPNPVQGMLQVSLNQAVTSDMQVRVMDASGRIVMALQLNPVQKFELETQSLNNGVYFIQVNANEFNFNQPFVVQN
jgi:hypothetical protein